MKIASSSSTETDPAIALQTLFEDVDNVLDTARPHLVLFFATPHFEDEFEDLRHRIRNHFENATSLGCTVEGVIGPERELERRPAMALWAANLPDTRIRSFTINQAELEVTAESGDWKAFLQTPDSPEPTFLLLGDPFRFDITRFLGMMDQVYPGRPVIGGMASAAERPGQNILWVDNDLLRDGVVGISISGNLRITPIVSQGCKPIGRHLVITKAQQNVIQELGGKPALAMLQEITGEISKDDLALAKNGLFVGRAVNEYQESFGRGDFLIRNLMGTDPKNGALVIGDYAKTGTTVQFHVRDGDSADEDLRAILQTDAAAEGKNVHGALLFSCNGRGTRMWDEPGHDVHLLREIFGDIPVAGAFCAGEFGPLAQQNFIHGHTASIALFREAL